MKSFLVLIAAMLLAGAASAEVNINTANADELAQELTNVGPAKAAAIVEYREMHGAFNSVNELTEVQGIGERTLEMNQHLILLHPPQSGVTPGGEEAGDSGIANSVRSKN